MNTKTRRILSVLLVLCMSFALMATAAFAADTETADVAEIKLNVTGKGASADMTFTAKAEVTMTEKQAEAAAALGVEELAKKEFTCVLTDSEGFIASVEQQVKNSSIVLNDGSIFERVSSKVQDGSIVVVYKIKDGAIAKDAKAADIKAKLLAEKATVTSVVEKVAVTKDVDATVTAKVCMGDTLLAEGKTQVAVVANMPFVDVSTGWYYAPVAWAVSQKPVVTKGTDETHFSPEEACTRAQVVTFLWRAAGEPKAAEGTVNPFVDVKSDAYYYDAVLWAVAKKVTNGTDDTHFSPAETCTRAQVVTFLWRYDGEKTVTGTNPFVDVRADAYYTTAVIWAVQNGVTTGADATHFEPVNTCERDHVVTFLHRYMTGLDKTAA